MPRKKTRSELEIAELRYRSLVEKRNEFNDEARSFRDERDTLNQQKRELLDEMRDLREKRDGLVAEMRDHKALRNEMQKKARELIASRRDKRKGLQGNVDKDMGALQDRIDRLEMKQETVPMDLKEEAVLLDDIKKSRQDLVELEGLYAQREEVLKGIRGVDEAIDELFRRADEEHQAVVTLYEKSHEVHEKYVGLVNEVSHLIAESDKKHEEFLKVRERADHYHGRAMEMREKILSIRRERAAESREARKFIRDRRRATKRETEAMGEASADEALKTLKKTGKLELK